MQISHPLARAVFLAISLSRISNVERDSALCPMRVFSVDRGAAKSGGRLDGNADADRSAGSRIGRLDVPGGVQPRNHYVP